MIQLKIIDQHSVNWDSVFESSLVLNDSFRNDFMRSEYWPPQYQFDRLPTGKSYDELLKDKYFRIATESMTRQMILNIRRNPRYRLMTFRDDDRKQDSVVGMAAVILPEYYSVPSLSLPYQLKTFLLSILYKLQDWWSFRSVRNPLLPSRMLAEFKLGDEKCETMPTKERIDYLKTLSEELTRVHYPKPWSYYLNYFAVKLDEQGKGVGRQMMNMIIDNLRNDVGVVNPPSGGPAKLEMFSSPAGVDFYKRYGFTLAANYTNVQPSGRLLKHSFFFLNLA